MLKQTAESRDRGIQLVLGGKDAYVDLGAMRDVLFGHHADRDLGWSLCWDEPAWPIESPSDEFRLATQSGPICLAVRHSLRAKTTVCESMNYSVGDYAFGLERQPTDGKSKYEMVSNGFHLARPQARPYVIGPPVKSYGFPDTARLSFTNADFLQGFELSFERAMATVQYLGPLREDPQRQYTWSGNQPVGVGSRGELVVDALLAARERGQKVRTGPKSHHKLENYVATWLQRLGLVDAFKVEEVREGSSIFQVLVRQAPRSAWVPITDVGFGVSQVLPVLTLCFAAPENSTIILEQPEIHLHPKVQSGLADVLIDAIRTRGVQLIVESHSEHLLQRLLRRIAEAKVAPDEAALYFCDNPGSGSTIERLEVDLFGSIRNWPRDFFGDPLGESLATVEAAQHRRLNASA